MKDWQHGFTLEALDVVVDIFETSDVGYVLGDMQRVNRRHVAGWLHKRQILISPSRRSAVVASISQKQQSIKDFTGRNATTMPARTFVVQRIAGDVLEIADLLRPTADRLAGMCLTGWIDSPVVRSVVDLFKLSLVATKIRATSEIVGVYANLGARPLPSYEVTGIVPLSWFPNGGAVDVSAAATEVEQLDDWVTHYSNYNISHSWQALSLRSYGGAIDEIVKPSEMTRAWRRDNPAMLTAECVDTPLRDALKACQSIVDALPGGPRQRVRLMKLIAGGTLERHSDISDRQVGVHSGKVARLHVPLITNDAVEFSWWDLDAVQHDVRMNVGELHYIDIRKPHRAHNGGHADRVHLVVDVEADSTLRRLLS